MSQDREPGWYLDAQLADLIAYCRAVSGREDDAVGTAHAARDSALDLLTDPGQLRVWLFALARMEILAGSEPQAVEVFDLVHRLGIQPEDLPVVLRITPVEADRLLVAAEAQYRDDTHSDDGPGWEDSPHLSEGQRDQPAVGSPAQMLDAQLAHLVAYCRSITGSEEDAASAADAVLDSARSLLTDPGRLRAWLFALARQDMLADAAPGTQEILDLVHQHGIRAEDLPTVLGIPPAEADELLAAAEEEYASTAVNPGHHEAGSRHSETLHDDRSWDDRAGAWDGGPGRADGAGWDEVSGPESHRLPDLPGLFRRRSEPAGRHAAPTFGAGLRRALHRGPARVAAATAIVVALIGISAAYLAASTSPPPSQAGQQTGHHAAAVSRSPATPQSPVLTATPTQSPTPSQQVTVVLTPQPAPASPGPSPRPSPKPSPAPSTSSSSSTSPSPSASPSPSPI